MIALNVVGLAAGIAALSAMPTDTIVELSRGDRVILENLTGEISVRAWERDELELQGEEGEMPLVVRRSGSTVRITRDDRKGRRRSVEASVRVPAWVDVEIGGPSLDVWVDGIDGRLEVNSVSGDVWIENGGGRCGSGRSRVRSTLSELGPVWMPRRSRTRSGSVTSAGP